MENPQAFPTDFEAYGGMSLRDYFAAAALQAIGGYLEKEPDIVALTSAWARLSYQIADAMLAERAK